MARSSAPAAQRSLAFAGTDLPQLTQLVDAAPEGDEWLHEIKFDGYRMHARLERGSVKLLTRTGLDWTHKYPAVAAAVGSLGARQAYLDRELSGVFPDGIMSFSMIQPRRTPATRPGWCISSSIFCIWTAGMSPRSAVIQRKARLAELLSNVRPPLHYSDYHRGRDPAFHEQACKLELERDVVGLDVAGFAQSLKECGHEGCRGTGRCSVEETNYRHCLLLRAQCSR
jgi:ATP-dependent DNA ligase